VISGGLQGGCNHEDYQKRYVAFGRFYVRDQRRSILGWGNGETTAPGSTGHEGPISYGTILKMREPLNPYQHRGKGHIISVGAKRKRG
jgi:hypothetical protein